MNSNRCEPKGAWYTASGSSTWIVLLILLAALTLTSLTGCSTRYAVYPVIDSRLTAPCDWPIIKGPTYRDAIVLGIERGEALEDCANQIDRIRELTR